MCDANGNITDLDRFNGTGVQDAITANGQSGNLNIEDDIESVLTKIKFIYIYKMSESYKGKHSLLDTHPRSTTARVLNILAATRKSVNQ